MTLGKRCIKTIYCIGQLVPVRGVVPVKLTHELIRLYIFVGLGKGFLEITFNFCYTLLRIILLESLKKILKYIL